MTISLAEETYVVLTTRKRSGETVATPVWIAGLADGGLGFTTNSTSGKIKRIRNFPDVTIQASNSLGAPRPGTEPVAARAVVLNAADAKAVDRAIAQKYGIALRLVNLIAAIDRLVRRRGRQLSVAVRLDLV